MQQCIYLVADSFVKTAEFENELLLKLNGSVRRIFIFLKVVI